MKPRNRNLLARRGWDEYIETEIAKRTLNYEPGNRPTRRLVHPDAVPFTNTSVLACENARGRNRAEFRIDLEREFACSHNPLSMGRSFRWGGSRGEAHAAFTVPVPAGLRRRAALLR